MTLVIALQNAVVFSVNLADSLMLGAYSEAALSGVFLVNQIQFFLQMLVTGAAEGMLIFASRSWGEGDIDGIKRISNIGMRCVTVISAVLFAACAAFPGPILSVLSSSTEFVSEGVKYLRIVCFTYPVFAATNAIIYMLRSAESTRIGFYVSLFALFFNIFLNYALIFGNFGFPEMGAEGAAVATLVSRLAELGFASWYLFFRDKKLGAKPSDFFTRIDGKLFRDYVKTGFPVFFSGAIWGLAMSVQTAILGHMGDAAISANSIATTLFQIVTVFTYGSASAASVIIGKTLGEGRKDLMRPYARTMQVLFVGIGIITGLLLFALRVPIVSLYDVSEGSASLALDFILVLAVTCVGTSYQMPVLTGIVRAGGETDFVLKNDMIFMWLIVIPVSAAFAFLWQLPPIYVFIALKSDQLLKCAVAAVKVNRFKWIRDISGKRT